MRRPSRYHARMATLPSNPLDARRDQMFPTLARGRYRAPAPFRRGPRLCRRRAYREGRRRGARPDRRAVGQRRRSPRMAGSAGAKPSSRTARASFVGELAQLSGRPSLVDAEALEPVEALVIRSRAPARPDGAGGRARRAHHAGADPAPRRAAGERRRAARSSSAAPTMPTCCGCRASSPATASRTSVLDPDSRCRRQDA